MMTSSSSSSAKLPAYQKLQHQDDLDDDFEYEKVRALTRSTTISTTSWCRFRFRKVHIKRRFKKLKVPSLKRFLFLRRKLIKLACAKVLKRFKEGQSHFGDLFAGNYLFLQINPSSLKNLQKSTHHHLQFNGLPTRKIA